MTAGPNHDVQRGDVLRLQRRVTGQGIVVQVAGELDLNTSPSLVADLTTARAQARPPGPLIVDLTDVTFMASVGLSILIAHSRLCQEANMELRVVAGNRTVARMISRTGLDAVLAVFTTLTEALTATH